MPTFLRKLCTRDRDGGVGLLISSQLDQLMGSLTFILTYYRHHPFNSLIYLTFGLKDLVNFPTHIDGHWLDITKSVALYDGLSDYVLSFMHLTFANPKFVRKIFFGTN